ncbi:MAG: hypothetical protein ACLQBX_18905 [Candidatus Limnocylindrales bacterium]
MALIPPAFLDAVVAIGFPNADGTTRWAASGFVYGELFAQVDGEPNRYRTYLVTNRHVLAGEKTMVLRFNPEADEPAREFRAELLDTEKQPIWAPHPNQAIDIAILPVSVESLRQQGVRVFFLESDHHVLFREQAASEGLTEGDGVFALGFPMGNVVKGAIS